jgi:hypothetical protein
MPVRVSSGHHLSSSWPTVFIPLLRLPEVTAVAKMFCSGVIEEWCIGGSQDDEDHVSHCNRIRPLGSLDSNTNEDSATLASFNPCISHGSGHLIVVKPSLEGVRQVSREKAPTLRGGSCACSANEVKVSPARESAMFLATSFSSKRF